MQEKAHEEVSALVIGRKFVNDADGVLTLLTANNGVIQGYAPGVRRKNSKLRSGCELLSYGDFMLFSHRGRISIDSVSSRRAFMGVRENMEKLALCSYFAQLCAETGVAELSTDAQLKLFLTALHLLDKNRRGSLQIKPVFELRLMSLLGFQPDLRCCGVCGAVESEQMVFSLQQGILLCSHCAKHLPTNHAHANVPVSQTLIDRMQAMIYGSHEEAFGAVLSPQETAALNGLTEHFVCFQLERGFDTLAYFQNIYTQMKQLQSFAKEESL